jgi:hypothetical protein
VLEVPVPKYFIEDRAKELDDRDKFLEALVDKYAVRPQPPAAVIPPAPPLPEDEAIAMIQRNERGRHWNALVTSTWLVCVVLGCGKQACNGHVRLCEQSRMSLNSK